MSTTPISPHTRMPTGHEENSSYLLLPSKVGIAVQQDYANDLRHKIKDLLGYKNDGFPGAQPVALTRDHLQSLEREDYYVCEKSDGVRYLMLLMVTQKGPATFMIDRMNQLHYIDKMQFPLPRLPGDSIKFHNHTLLDGELVVDVVGAHRTLTYLVFDFMFSNGEKHTHENYSRRLGIFQRDVQAPYEAHLKNNPELRNHQPFRLAIKAQQRSYGMSRVFEDITKQKHGNDGLIFTSVNLPYTPGTCPKILKWKPPELMTIDFQIKVDYDMDRKPQYSLFIGENGHHRFHDRLSIETEVAAQWRISPPDGRIGEFRWDADWPTYVWEIGYVGKERRGGWRFIRFRDDKDMANDITVLQDTKLAILNGVSKEMLLSWTDSIRSFWKLREQSISLPPRHPHERKSSTMNVPSTPAYENPPSVDHSRDSSHGHHRKSSSGSTVSEYGTSVDTRRNSGDRQAQLDKFYSTSPGGLADQDIIARGSAQWGHRGSGDSSTRRLSMPSDGVSDRRQSLGIHVKSPGAVGDSGTGGGSFTPVRDASPLIPPQSVGTGSAGSSSPDHGADGLPARKKSFTELMAHMPKGIRLKKATSSFAESTPSSSDEAGGKNGSHEAVLLSAEIKMENSTQIPDVKSRSDHDPSNTGSNAQYETPNSTPAVPKEGRGHEVLARFPSLQRSEKQGSRALSKSRVDTLQSNDIQAGDSQTDRHTDSTDAQTDSIASRIAAKGALSVECTMAVQKESDDSPESSAEPMDLDETRSNPSAVAQGPTDDMVISARPAGDSRSSADGVQEDLAARRITLTLAEDPMDVDRPATSDSKLTAQLQTTKSEPVTREPQTLRLKSERFDLPEARRNVAKSNGISDGLERSTKLGKSLSQTTTPTEGGSMAMDTVSNVPRTNALVEAAKTSKGKPFHRKASSVQQGSTTSSNTHDSPGSSKASPQKGTSRKRGKSTSTSVSGDQSTPKIAAMASTSVRPIAPLDVTLPPPPVVMMTVPRKKVDDNDIYEEGDSSDESPRLSMKKPTEFLSDTPSFASNTQAIPMESHSKSSPPKSEPKKKAAAQRKKAVKPTVAGVASASLHRRTASTPGGFLLVEGGSHSTPFDTPGSASSSRRGSNILPRRGSLHSAPTPVSLAPAGYVTLPDGGGYIVGGSSGSPRFMTPADPMLVHHHNRPMSMAHPIPGYVAYGDPNIALMQLQPGSPPQSHQMSAAGASDSRRRSSISQSHPQHILPHPTSAMFHTMIGPGVSTSGQSMPASLPMQIADGVRIVYAPAIPHPGPVFMEGVPSGFYAYSQPPPAHPHPSSAASQHSHPSPAEQQHHQSHGQYDPHQQHPPHHPFQHQVQPSSRRGSEIPAHHQPHHLQQQAPPAPPTTPQQAPAAPGAATAKATKGSGGKATKTPKVPKKVAPKRAAQQQQEQEPLQQQHSDERGLAREEFVSLSQPSSSATRLQQLPLLAPALHPIAPAFSSSSMGLPSAFTAVPPYIGGQHHLQQQQQQRHQQPQHHSQHPHEHSQPAHYQPPPSHRHPHHARSGSRSFPEGFAHPGTGPSTANSGSAWVPAKRGSAWLDIVMGGSSSDADKKRG
ncbi:hypothetical protein PhCBS80983_g06090 [Powellomyces hirtus]|uniref:mRNA guanylyltransferase n=1 Tax=Powellomyces hirtus TaxID=109895 RepID=A0A507DRS7_9FUNG|nr:hypothetical protein PhCBS80983_g06090 [Powellomyces hirtus]